MEENVMDKIDTEKNQESESFPIISDWINFLNSEKHNTVSNVLNFAVLFVALIAIVFAIKVERRQGLVYQIRAGGGQGQQPVIYPLQGGDSLAEQADGGGGVGNVAGWQHRFYPGVRFFACGLIFNHK